MVLGGIKEIKNIEIEALHWVWGPSERAVQFGTTNGFVVQQEKTELGTMQEPKTLTVLGEK